MSTEADKAAINAAAEFNKNITNVVCEVTERRKYKAPLAWYIVFSFSLFLIGCLLWALYTLFTQGVGVWGNNNAEPGHD